MAIFHHRKLMMPYSEPPSNLTQICSTICNNLNYTAAAICTNTSCSDICPQICPNPLTPLESPPPPPPSYFSTTHSKLSSTLKISIGFLIITFSIFVLYTFYKFYTVWSRSRRNQDFLDQENDQENQMGHQDFLDDDHGPMLDHPIWYIRTVGLQPNVISAINIVKYKKFEGLVEGTDCSICLSEFQEDETLRLLPKCNHAFHIPCIDTWLQSHTNCPLCRAGIVRNGGVGVSFSTRELVVEDSSSLEDSQMGVLISTGESEAEREDVTSPELRDGSEDEDEMSKLEMGNGEVVMRRSVSLDCLSAARLSAEIDKGEKFQSGRNLGSELEQSDSNVVRGRVESGCSIASSLQRGPDFIKRSLSCSGKVLLPRQSK